MTCLSKCLNPPKGPDPISTSSSYTDQMSYKLSQSPVGSWADFHRKKRVEARNPNRRLSQSPEGSWADFHLVPIAGTTTLTSSGCRNPPKGPGPISTENEWGEVSGGYYYVAIPRRVLVRFPRKMDDRVPSDEAAQMSQSPEGSWADFHSLRI